MYSKILALVALSAATANASILSAVSSTVHVTPDTGLTARQATGSGPTVDEFIDELPAACRSTCNSTIEIYPSCQEGDLLGCLAVCEQDTYDEIMDCLNCGFREDDKTYSPFEASTLRRQWTSVNQGCRQRGFSLQTQQLEIPTESGSAPSAQSSSAQPDPSGSAGGNQSNAARGLVVNAAGLAGVAGVVFTALTLV